jgi:anthranilate phosphoribosyltransferase
LYLVTGAIEVQLNRVAESIRSEGVGVFEAETGFNPIVEGIKKIGVGKHGSDSCSEELSGQIFQQIQNGKSVPIQNAVFLSALFLKKPSLTEKIFELQLGESLFQRPDVFASHFFGESTIEHFWVKRVFSGEDLSVQEAYELGSLLFSESFDQQAKAMIATYLRMKHACVGEYEGILKALDECYHRHSKAKTDGKYDRKERILWQISEPFDGLDRNFLLTPLLGQLLKKRGHEAIYLGGPSSGPKFGTNISTIYDDQVFERFELGNFFNIESLFSGFKEWRYIRGLMIKRPFMATIEKYFNPFSSDVLITSVFHGSFKEKGNELIQKAGFRAGIVIFKGLEGSVQPSLARGTRLLASYQNREGLVVERDFEIRPEQFGFSICPDNKERKISPEDSKRLLIEYLEAGATSDSYYNQRARYLIRAFEGPLHWIESQFSEDAC